MLNNAYRALRAGQLTQAQAVYSEALRLDRNLSDAWIGLASIAAQSGDKALAEQHYQQALRINPNDSVAQAGMATLAENADPVNQESRLRNLAARGDGDAAVQFALGNTLARQGRWAEAQQAYFQASAAEPAQPDYAFNLAISLEHMRQHAAAITHYQRAIEAASTAPASFDPTKARARIEAIRAQGVDQ
jgi:tetratricopeptide (TPR) repeat protein